MEITTPEIQLYAEQHTSDESSLLKSINRETYLNVLYPRMLSGHLQGRLLAMMSKMIKPKRILEIGTFTGYSALCLAEGLAKGGKIITIEANEELETRARGYFNQSEYKDRIDFRIGDAMEIIPALDEEFDLVFIDANKFYYSDYYDTVFDKVKIGGFILADNVLWDGKVLSPNPDKDTRAVMAFNKKIQEDGRIENVLLPVRDGIMMVRRIC
jgi:caffeoyl-CoA O-methyltransferase